MHRLLLSLPRSTRVIRSGIVSVRRVSSAVTGRAYSPWRKLLFFGAGLLSGGGIWALMNRRRIQRPSQPLNNEENLEKDGEKPRKVSKREQRYRKFASIMYEGEIYMSPRDFLESVTLDNPRIHGYCVMDDKTLSSVLKHTPDFSKGSPTLFRTIWKDGILTYADYLFLLTALIKPHRQFEIVFRMIDVDGSDTVDQSEFLEMQKTVTKRRENALLEKSNLDHSTLTIHLFGRKGTRKLSSKDLFKFIDNLQTEVTDMEFQRYSQGAPTISAEQFAEILLYHTNFDMAKVKQRLSQCNADTVEGISFSQFKEFCELLNALDDFAVAMTMYTIAGESVTEEEFSRASHVCIGKPLDKHVVHVVFRIFDLDGDGKLSYREFLSVMKNWRLRGMKLREKKIEGAWPEFKTCMKMEMRA